MALDVADTETIARAREIATRLKPLEGPLLPILHEVQETFGHVPASALPAIADVLNLTAAEVHGTMSFYPDFRTAPAGRMVVKICRAEACKAMGGDALAAEVQERMGLGWHETSADERATLEPVYCLGLCACAPTAMVGDTLIGRADAAAVLRAAGEDTA
ncbi:formate dehydrogenase subunit gamma [Tropicimonas aquimaris]|uniref:Formate dehydrogenase subunit gamma n=1 Tax=Tropicimonas aquimaris TaxID=914152 RepID=A0ABW3ILM1_9RHOB